MDKLYTMNQIAEMLHLSVRTIQNYIKDGKLNGKKIGSQWRFTEEDISTLLADENFLQKKTSDEKNNLKKFLEKTSVEEPEIYSILHYPYNSKFKIKTVMKKINEAIQSSKAIRFYFTAEEKVFTFFLEGDSTSVKRLQELIDGEFCRQS